MKYTVMVTAASLAALLCGCTSTEVKETGTNVLGVVLDAAKDVLADPTKVATPTGIAVLAGTAAAGFFTRQSASVAKWMHSKSSGPLIKLIGKACSKHGV